MNTDSIYRNIGSGARLLVRVVVKAGALSGMLMNRVALSFPIMLESATMKAVVGITIHQKNISSIIPIY